MSWYTDSSNEDCNKLHQKVTLCDKYIYQLDLVLIKFVFKEARSVTMNIFRKKNYLNYLNHL